MASTDIQITAKVTAESLTSLVEAVQALRAIEVADRVDHSGHVGEGCDENTRTWNSRMGRDLATALDKLEIEVETQTDMVSGNPAFRRRIENIAADVVLGENFGLKIGFDGRFYFQITYYREDVITHLMGYGYGGKGYVSEHATDSELVQTIFGLYKGFWEHESRETFQWRKRRVFGPHIATEALWDVAKRVDVRSAKHVEDQP